jgi:hypothetical protein
MKKLNIENQSFLYPLDLGKQRMKNCDRYSIGVEMDSRSVRAIAKCPLTPNAA